MSGAGRSALIGLLMFLLGTIVGTISSAPEPRTITETKEIEVVREVEVPVEVEVIREVPQPLPDECKQLPSEARMFINKSNRLAMKYREIVDGLQDFDLNLVRTTNQEAINSTIVDWSQDWNSLDNALWATFGAEERFEARYLLCKDALAE
jgi:hypothetical protein